MLGKVIRFSIYLLPSTYMHKGFSCKCIQSIVVLLFLLYFIKINGNFDNKFQKRHSPRLYDNIRRENLNKWFKIKLKKKNKADDDYIALLQKNASLQVRLEKTKLEIKFLLYFTYLKNNKQK